MSARGIRPDGAVRNAGRLALLAAVLTVGLIAYGSWVRVSGSGLGCPDWPLCEGGIVPELEGDTAIEFGHRAYAGITMLLTAVAAWVAHRGRASDPLTAKLLLGALVAILAQAVLGGITVLTELHGMVRLAHLTFSLLTLSLLTGGAVRGLDVRPAAAPVLERWRALAVATAFVVLVGGTIVGTGQSGGCPGLPLCDDRSSTSAFWVHGVHRIAATLLVLALVWTAWQSRKLGGLAFALSVAAALAAVAQFTVGVTAVWLTLPQALRILHLALAAVVWWVVSAQLSLALKGSRR